MTLQEKLQENTKSLFVLLEGISEEQAKHKPAVDTWSVLECVEHIFLVDVGVSKTLTVTTPQEAENDKSELFSHDKLHHILVNKRSDFKVPAPDFVTPKGKFQTLEEAKKGIEIVIEKIIFHLNTNDISKETHTIAHPRLGEMTKTDWVHFLISHTNRHLLQIRELLN